MLTEHGRDLYLGSIFGNWDYASLDRLAVDLQRDRVALALTFDRDAVRHTSKDASSLESSPFSVDDRQDL